jgi:glycogen debranching enzyme
MALPADFKDKGQDLRELVSDHDKYLLPNERVLFVKEEKITFPKKAIDVHEALALLCNVKNIKDIGKKGPPMASIAPKEYSNIKSLRLYEAVFGRDSLYMVDHLLNEFPDLARTTLLFHASMQGTKKNKMSEEEEGRIPHEVRDASVDVVAQEITKQKGWEWPYYGSIDSTLLFIRVLYRYISETKAGINFLNAPYTDKDGKELIMHDALIRAVQWILKRMKTNPEGFIENLRMFKGSLGIQSLQDSDTGSSLFHKNGTLSNLKKGIVITEVQGQAYDALIYAAELLRWHRYEFGVEMRLGRKINAKELEAKARKLKKSIFKYLWVEEKDKKGKVKKYFAPGADRDEKNKLKTFKIKKAIPGFLLNTELFGGFKKFDENENQKVRIRENKSPSTSSGQSRMLRDWINVLMSKEMLAAGGLRGLASDEIYFTPYAYHNGCAWPVITYEVARGLRRQGFKKQAINLEERILKIVKETGLYPEYVRGDFNSHITLNNRVIYTKDKIFGIHRREQPPQLYQGWTVSAVAAILYNRKHGK